MTAPGSDTPRVFLAVDLDTEIRHGLAAHLDAALGPGGAPGRVAPPANWHLTVRFLGPVDPISFERLLAALDETELSAAFTLAFTGLGAFPRPARATVLWLGVGDGREELTELAATVEELVAGAGLPPDDRPFHPHLTLSRIRPPQDVRAVIERFPPFPGRQRVRALTVFESKTGRGPAVYRPLASFPLPPARRDPSLRP